MKINNTLADAANMAAEAHFKRNGFEILRDLENGSFDFVLKDEDCLRLVNVAGFEANEREEFEAHHTTTPKERKAIESEVINFVISNNQKIKDTPFEVDRLDLLVIGGSNALLRWRKNVFGAEE